MSHSGQDESRDDPLLCAIEDLRQDLIRWIDGRLSQYRQREAQPETPSAASAASMGLPMRSESRVENDAPSNGKPAAHESHTGQADTRSRGDARVRLDALARQLGERLRLWEASRKGPDKEGANNSEADRCGPAR